MVAMQGAERHALKAVTGAWWVSLATGVMWMLVALVVLRFDFDSLAAVGTLLGTVLILAAANELLTFRMRNIGWKALHLLMGLLFLVGGVLAFTRPVATFVELASILGFVLMLKGSFDIIGAAVARETNELWWLGVVVGLLEVLLAFWVSQQLFAPRAALIIVWVGFTALFRGFSEISLAFELRSWDRRLTRDAVPPGGTSR